MGRPKQFTERIQLAMVEGTISRIDARLGDGEYRLDLIRAAIEAELERRAETDRRPRSGTAKKSKV